VYVIQQLIGISKYSGADYQTAQDRAFNQVRREICSIDLAVDFLQHELVCWFNDLVSAELKKLRLDPQPLRGSPLLTDLLDSHFLTQLNLNSEEDNIDAPESIAKAPDDPAQAPNAMPPEPLDGNINDDDDGMENPE
jgi:hypothetical protein